MGNTKKLTDQQNSRLFGGLALLLHAGISLADGVYLLAEEETVPVQPLLLRLGTQLDQGVPFSAAAAARR